MSTEQAALPDTATPDAEWLAGVRADAGRWWATWDDDLANPLVLYRDGARWSLHHHPSADVIGGVWPTERTARLWLWLALGAANWHTGLTPERLTAEQRAVLTALERRLRAALGLMGGAA